VRFDWHNPQQWPKSVESWYVGMDFGEISTSDDTRFNTTLWHGRVCDSLSAMEIEPKTGSCGPEVGLADPKSVTAAHNN